MNDLSLNLKFSASVAIVRQRFKCEEDVSLFQLLVWRQITQVKDPNVEIKDDGVAFIYFSDVRFARQIHAIRHLTTGSNEKL